MAHEFVFDMSMSSLHTPTSLIEYAIRRELYGEGLLAVKKDALLTASVAGKYPHLQKAYLKQVDDAKEEKARALALAIPPSRSASVGGSSRNTLSAATLPPTAGSTLGAAGKSSLSGSRRTPGTGRDATLHGNLGTGNNVSHGFPARHPGPMNAQPPLQVPRRSFMENLATRVTPEERKLTRTMTKHYLRNLIQSHGVRGKELVYKVERLLFEQCFSDAAFKEQFFASERFATELLQKVAKQLEEPEKWAGGKEEEAPGDQLGGLEQPKNGHHAYDCGPRCYCMKYQDAALSVKTDKVVPDKSWTKQMGKRSDAVLSQLSAMSPVQKK